MSSTTTTSTTSTTTTEHNANTIEVVGQLIHIFDIDIDWKWLETFTGQNHGLLLEWIRVVAGAANDRVVFRWEDENGSIFFDETIRTDLQPIHVPYYGARFKPFLDFSAGIYTGNPEIFILMR